MQLTYLIEFVADMDRAVGFYRDSLGLPLKFQTPDWTEFATGSTTFALHLASAEHPAGQLKAGFSVPDIHQFYGDATARGVEFVSPPTVQKFGATIAELKDCEGTVASVSRMGR
jgi:catechol 2,3-dioxygenase-like lactoylglutathione lyase family enzyme